MNKRKIFVLILAISMLASALGGCEKHEHEFTKSEAAPTCTEQGYVLHSCADCGLEEKHDYVDAAGHKKGEWVVVDEPTMTEDGLKRVNCETCGEIISEKAIPKLEPEADDEDLSVPADESSSPIEDISDPTHGEYESDDESSMSDASESDEVSSESEVSDSEVHTCSFIADKKTEPTCTAQGYTVYKCSCGKSEKKDYVSALGHSASSWVTITAATATSTGLKRKSCTRCGVTLDEETIAKLTAVHTCSFTADKKTEPTCTAQGYTIYKCSCGKSDKRDHVSALGHKEGSWITITEATATSTGLKRKSCTRCGTMISEETIAQLSPESIYDAVATEENTYLVEERILYYINQYRVAEGSCEMTMLEGKSRAFARGRSVQLIDNFAHDTEERRALATELEYGYYIPEQPETIYDWETDTIISTGNTIPAYYEPYGGEAIGGPFVSTGHSVDTIAKKFAKACYESKSHWSYIGSNDNPYIAMGASVSYDNAWYVCYVALNDYEANLLN